MMGVGHRELALVRAELHDVAGLLGRVPLYVQHRGLRAVAQPDLVPRLQVLHPEQVALGTAGPGQGRVWQKALGRPGGCAAHVARLHRLRLFLVDYSPASADRGAPPDPFMNSWRGRGAANTFRTREFEAHAFSLWLRIAVGADECLTAV